MAINRGFIGEADDSKDIIKIIDYEQLHERLLWTPFEGSSKQAFSFKIPSP